MENSGKYYTMFLGLLVLITALTISGIAIYYSVAGLVAIFAAAALPIMIMGGALEIGKLVTAVWLHKYWKQAAWWLKSYLSIAVIILMFITSMGIFGFLSKAHIEQTSASEESVAKIESIETETVRLEKVIARAENKIQTLESSGTGSDTNIQNQIDKEQKRIDTAYDRIQPAIAEQNAIIANVTTLFQRELANIDASIANLQSYIDAGDIKKAQGMIGSKADGAYGPKTAAAFTAWTDAKKLERNEWIQKIQDAAQSDTIVSARKEISKLRDKADNQIAESNKLINRLRTQVGKTDKVDEINLQVDEQNLRIKTANTEIDLLTEEQYSLEGEYRQLEAEVGPIKYIAEFVYGEDADKNMLEKAVTWVIIIIIFVFDPLAVLLLIASQYTFDFARRNKGISNDHARMQKIDDNPGPKDPDEKIEVPNYVDIDQETIDKEFAAETTKIIAQSYMDATPEEEVPVQKKSIKSLEGLNKKDIPDTANRMFYTEELEIPVVQKYTDAQLDELDLHPVWQDAKHRWKNDNPNETLKEHKQKYKAGIINRLPWEDYVQPDLDSEDNNPEYIQNQEQSESSIWKTIGDK